MTENPQYNLDIFTALSLTPPDVQEDLGQRFLGPFAKKQWGDYPKLQYFVDAANNKISNRINVHEFYFHSLTKLRPLQQSSAPS